MSGYVYILQLSNNKFYVGSTNNLNRRTREHQLGQEKYTKKYLPVTLLFSQEYPSIYVARAVEHKIKSLKSAKIIQKIVLDKYINVKIAG